MKGSGYSIRRYRPGDEISITQLLNRVFSRLDPSFVPKKPEWWIWKYANNPSGYHCLVAEGPGGPIVAHYGGVPLLMRAEGETFQFGQNCDTFSDPAVRRGLRNPGLFVRLGQAYASTYGRPAEDAVMYGLPSEEACRLGSRYLDYWMLRSQMALGTRNSNSFPKAAEPDNGKIRLEEIDSFPPEIDRFTEGLESEYSCIARRDSRFLNWRLRDHPERPYRMVLARDDDSIRGYAAYRKGTFIGRQGGILIDWLVSKKDEEATGALLRWSMTQCWRDRLKELFVLFPTSSSWFVQFQNWGFRAEATPYTMTARPYDRKFEPSYLRSHWYYTLADFDID